jgi:hypothetical protein
MSQRRSKNSRTLILPYKQRTIATKVKKIPAYSNRLYQYLWWDVMTQAGNLTLENNCVLNKISCMEILVPRTLAARFSVYHTIAASLLPFLRLAQTALFRAMLAILFLSPIGLLSCVWANGYWQFILPTHKPMGTDFLFSSSLLFPI